MEGNGVRKDGIRQIGSFVLDLVDSGKQRRSDIIVVVVIKHYW